MSCVCSLLERYEWTVDRKWSWELEIAFAAVPCKPIPLFRALPREVVCLGCICNPKLVALNKAIKQPIPLFHNIYLGMWAVIGKIPSFCPQSTSASWLELAVMKRPPLLFTIGSEARSSLQKVWWFVGETNVGRDVSRMPRFESGVGFLGWNWVDGSGVEV